MKAAIPLTVKFNALVLNVTEIVTDWSKIPKLACIQIRPYKNSSYFVIFTYSQRSRPSERYQDYVRLQGEMISITTDFHAFLLCCIFESYFIISVAFRESLVCAFNFMNVSVRRAHFSETVQFVQHCIGYRPFFALGVAFFLMKLGVAYKSTQHIMCVCTKSLRYVAYSWFAISRQKKLIN